MDISIVIPLYNEEGSLVKLIDWIQEVMNREGYSFEIIFIDDGSTDGSWDIIQSQAAERPYIHGIKFRRNYGKSAALHNGFQKACGDVVITMDADLQDVPDEIPELYKMITASNYDLVSGWKKKRNDPLSKRIPSKLYNFTVRCVTKIKLHDFNCGLKAYKNKVIKNIEVYGEMHRYIPVIAKKAGFEAIGEKVVEHRKREHGVTKFGLERFVFGFLDLLSILFISKFGKRPMHLFGALGTLMFVIGFLAALYLGIQKLYYVHQHIQANLLTESPYFYLAITAMIIGTQLFVAGFLGEMVSRNANERNKYQIEESF